MRAELRITKGHKQGEAFPLGADEKIVLGRDPNCEIQVPSQTVSRFHFMLECRDGRFLLSDLHSKTGTYVNGLKVIHKELFPGDTIRAGDSEFRFHLPPEGGEFDPPTETRILLQSRPDEMIRRKVDVRTDELLERAKGADPAANLRIIQSLSTIYRIGNLIHAERDHERLFNTIMDTILSVVKADRGFLIMLDNESPDSLRPVVVRTKDRTDHGLVLTLSRTIVRETLERGHAILSSDTNTDNRFRGTESIVNFGIKSVMCVPLVSQKKILGAIYLDSVKRAGVFTEREFELVVAIGKQAGIAIERTLLERESENTKRRLEAVLRSVPVGLLSLDTSGAVTGWSTHNEKVFGYARAHAKSRLSLPDLLRDPDAAQHILEQVESSGGFEGEMIMRAADGREFPANVGIVRLIDSEGEAMGYSGYIQDISRQKEMQKQLVRQEKMAAVGLLAAGISHEFNNLLGSMSGFAQLAKRNSKHVDQLVDIVITQTKRAELITRNLLSFSRPKSAAREPGDMATIIENILRLTEKELNQANIHVEREFQAVPPVLMSVGGMEEIFLNLIINSRQAIGRNGKIRVSVGLEDERVVVRVSDTGRGIRKEHLERIFDPFFTTKGLGTDGQPGGTGLGLAMVANIIKEHQGEISVQSEVGEGTTFTISLPISEGDVVEEEEAEPGALPRPDTPRKVLVVDDEQPILDLFRGVLAGHEVTFASSGQEAIDRIHQDDFDIILMDILMPGDMDGFSLFDEIRAIGKKAKVYFVTARRMDSRLSAYVERADGYIRKPFNVDDILDVVSR